MKPLLDMTRALSDESRVRVLVMLRGGELCVCQIVDTVGLAPSTISKHMAILHQAGLVQRRKEGKWAYYRLPGREAPRPVHAALRWVFACVQDDRQVAVDVSKACRARKKDPEELCACYRG